MKKTRTLVGSLVAIVICFTMLLGTTFAWFTDSISSNNNIIKSGTLKVNAYWMEATKDPETDTWTKFSDAAIFNNDKWEPGYVEAKHLKVTNEGSLAFEYRLVIQPNGVVSELADVIDVYYFATATKLNARSEAENGVYIGTLADLIADPDGAAYGILLPDGATSTNDKEVEKEVKVTIAFKMQEELGNEYQGLSIGSTFDIVLYATQYEFENDSFGNDYENGATIDDAILVHGGVIDLEGDITEAKTVAEGATVVINMNDNTMSDTLTNNGEVTINSGTIEVAKAGLENYGTATLTDVVMNAGSAAVYSNITSGSDAQTTYKNVEINSAGGGVGATNGATVTFNSGSVGVNSTSTSGRYLFYAAGEGTVITINEGEFADFTKTSQNQKRAYIYAGEGATVYVNGGTFGKASTRSGYTAGILGDGDVIISGGTFGFNPSTWVADGYAAVEVEKGKVWKVVEEADYYATNADELREKLEGAAAGEVIALMNDIVDIPVNNGAPYGNFYGIKLNGATLDGRGYTLHFDAPSGDNYGIMTTGGTIKNITIGGVFRGVMIMYPTQDLYIDNAIIGDEDMCYGLNTGESGDACNVYVSNSTLMGWNSFGDAVQSVSFTNCKFAQGTYYTNVYGRLVKPYTNATFENCEFSSNYYIDLSANKNGSEVVLRNCSVNGVKLTSESWKDLVVPEDVCQDGQISIELRDGTYLSASNVADYVIFE